MENSDEINDYYYKLHSDNDKDKENEFCSKEENKKINKIETKSQISKISNQSNPLSFIKTNSYVKLNGKLTISLGKNEKKELVNKYWIIKPEKKYDFYGKEIPKLYNNKKISNLRDLVGVLMIFKNFLSEDDIKRFDNYFSIIIKSNERKYNKEYYGGKILYIGGNLEDNLGNMFKKEFNEKDNNNIPIFISIRIYKEYEEIEIDALDYCNTIPSHDGFLKYKNVFHQNFPKNLSNKVKRIKNDRIQKRENLLKEDK